MPLRGGNQLQLHPTFSGHATSINQDWQTKHNIRTATKHGYIYYSIMFP